MIDPQMKIDPDRCMKCGFCMSVCPVYDIDHIENHVARGRNVLVRMVREGELPLEDDYRRCLYSCLLCRRCDSVCPANLSPAEITLVARNDVIEKKGVSWLQNIIYNGILSRRSLIARFVGLAGLIPGLSLKGGRPLRHLADLASFIPGALSLPRLSSRPLRKRISTVTKPLPGVKEIGQVAVFPGCMYEYFLPDIGEDIIMSLANAGFSVVFPEGLNCCGLSVHNAGDFKTSGLLASRNIEALSSYDSVITGCATCGSALKDYHKWLKEDDPWFGNAVEFSKKISDFSEFLVKNGFKADSDVSGPMTVTYHDPCHLRLHQGVYAAPRQILNSIEGIKYIEMENADACCGLGGSFSIAHKEISLAIQSKKMESIKKSGAQAVVTSCPGCMFYLAHGVRRNHLPVKVMHISRLTRGDNRVSR
jgi:glycolate oxidase iron-sulfur subunit